MLRRNVLTCSPTTGHFFDIIIIVSTEMKCPALIRQITSSENMLGMSGMVVGISYFSHGKKVWIPVRNRATFQPALSHKLYPCPSPLTTDTLLMFCQRFVFVSRSFAPNALLT